MAGAAVMSRRIALAMLIAACLAGAFPAPPASAAFPGKNGRVVFERWVPEPTDTNGGNWQLFSMAPDGSDVVQLTDLSGENWGPNWSPDGRRIVFASSSWMGSSDIYVMKSDGTRLRRVVKGGWDPSWSPSGKKIAFSRAPNDITQIYVARVDGSGTPRQVTNMPEDVLSPEWSPIGDRIGFIAAPEPSGRAEILTIHPDGTGLRRLTRGAGASSIEWSPDGSKIVFEDDRHATFDLCVATLWALCNSEIYVIDADGNNEIRLTENRAREIDPAWSPDGTQIVFARKDDPNFYDAYVMDADGGNEQLLLLGTEGDGAYEFDWGVRW